MLSPSNFFFLYIYYNIFFFRCQVGGDVPPTKQFYLFYTSGVFSSSVFGAVGVAFTNSRKSVRIRSKAST